MYETLLIEAPGKINLTLDIKGKRNDGYHELETVMHQINLVDRIYIKKMVSGILLKSNSDLITNDRSNLAYQAAELIIKTYNCIEGVSIYIDKNIPVGAGLAGGSTDAAAVLKGMNILFNLGISYDELAKMGACIGSDVPFCLLGKPRIILYDGAENADIAIKKEDDITGATSLARGRGEILSGLPNKILPWILVVKPDFQLSTADIYGAFKMENVYKKPDLNAFLKAWGLYDIIDISLYCENVLESVSTVLYPEIMTIKEELERLGATKAIMSGSGPSVFGIFNNYDETLQAQQFMKRSYKETYLISSYGRGD